MLAFIQQNIATILIGAALAALLALAVLSMVRNRLKGKSACGCDCGGCPGASSCHMGKEPR